MSFNKKKCPTNFSSGRFISYKKNACHTFASNIFSFSRNDGDADSFEVAGDDALFFLLFELFARVDNFFCLLILLSSASLSDADVPLPGATPSANKTFRRFSLKKIRYR